MPPTRDRLIPVLLLLLFMAATAHATDVFVPPVLKGVKGDGKARELRPVSFPGADEQWVLVRSKHFAFISSANAKRTKKIAEDLETLAVALAQLSPQFDPPPASPTRVIIFSRHREAQEYFDLLLQRDDANVSGVYVAQKSGGSMILDFGWGARSDRTPFHELVHHLIEESGANPPLWLEEGLADYFSNAEIRKGSIRVGEPVRQHIEALSHGKRIPLDAFFDVARESDTYNLAAGQRMFYAESWAIVDSLMRAAGRDSSRFYGFLHDVEQGRAVAPALQRRYGMTLADLNHALDRYGRFGPTSFGFTIAVPNVDTSTSSVSLDRADILYELGAFIAGIESESGEAERHFRAALAIRPRYARAIAAIGDLRAREARYDEAAKCFEQALAADPNDPAVDLSYAEALLETQIGPLAESEAPRPEDAPRFRKARQLAIDAIDHGTAELGRAYGDLGTSYIIENDAALAPGIAALEKARALAPARLDFTVHLFAMYRRTGDRAKADPLFALLDTARNSQVAYATRAVLMRVELRRAKEYVQQNKLSEAAAVIHELAANTADADAKADLERQAGHILHVAEQNRQIDVYNQAIGQVNGGDYRAAMKTLDALLASATDDGVIRDAKRLQERLKGRGRTGSGRSQ